MTEVVVLAGGLGTRLRGTVPAVPKPMAPVGGRPFLEHLLDFWAAQGIGRFILSVGYMHDAIVSHFGASYRGVPLDYAVENSPLGTGGGLLLAMKRLSGDDAFVLLNGDTYFEVRLRDLQDYHNAHKSDWTVALFRAPEAGRYMGVEVAEDSRITSLDSDAGKPGRLANGGVYLVEPEVLQSGMWELGVRLSLEQEILPAIIKTGQRLCGFEFTGKFIDIGVPEDYLRAPELLSIAQVHNNHGKQI